MTVFGENDRRNDLRIVVRASLDFTYCESSSGKVFTAEGVVLSLSQGGISFRTKKSLPNITYVEMEMQVPFINKTIKPMVQIIWRKNDKNQYGGQFSNLSIDDAKILDQYINYPSTTKKILMDRRMRDDSSGIPGSKERRKKNKQGEYNGC